MMSMYIVWKEIYKCGELDEVHPIAFESKKHILNDQKRENEWNEKFYGNDGYKCHIKRQKVSLEWCEEARPMVWVCRHRYRNGWYLWEDYKRLFLKGLVK